MRAVRIHEYGGPEVLQVEEVGIPSLSPERVLIRVQAAALNPVDVKTRKGGGFASFGTLPLILGWDLCGIVELVGESVTRFRPGDEVYGVIGVPQPGEAYAEFAAPLADELAPKPPSLNYNQAAAVPLAALTAMQSLYDYAQLQPGQDVLIHAAAGGVGHLAVQLARLAGARRIYATASSHNVDYLQQLGATDVIDYRSVNFEDVIRDVDVVLDGVGDEVRTRSLQVLKPGGILIGLSGKAPDGEPERAAALNVRVQHIRVKPSGEQLARVTSLLESGALKLTLSRVYPLEEAAQAHADLEQGHTRGKLVLSLA